MGVYFTTFTTGAANAGTDMHKAATVAAKRTLFVFIVWLPVKCFMN